MNTETQKAEDFVQLRLNEARLRIGVSPHRAMKWLLRVTQMAPEMLKGKDLENLRWELAFLAHHGTTAYFLRPSVTARRRPWGLDSYRYWIDEAPNPQEALSHQVLPALSDTKELFDLMQSDVLALVDKGHTTSSLISNKFSVQRTRSGLIEFSADPQSAKDGFIYSLHLLLSKHGGLIQRCPCCQTLFLSKRRDQQFCKGPCRAKFNIRRKRGTKPERFGKRGRPRKDTASPRLLKDKRKKVSHK